jgi:hypothetical protein
LAHKESISAGRDEAEESARISLAHFAEFGHKVFALVRGVDGKQIAAILLASLVVCHSDVDVAW